MAQDNVTFDTVSNSSAAEPRNYSDYSAIIGDGARSSTIDVDITYSTSRTYETEIWVDWNTDLDFDDTGILVFNGLSGSASPTTYNTSLFIPLAATLGQKRMRIGRTDNNEGPSSPRRSVSHGSFEDYTLNVTLAPTYLAIPTNLL
jgi:hypothetical protein